MKKLIMVMTAVVLLAGGLVLGIVIGYDLCDKDYEEYLPVVYGLGQQEVIEGIENMSKFYPELFQSIGNKNISYPSVVTYSMDYMDGTFFKILWAQNVNGRLIIERADTYNDVPIK